MMPSASQNKPAKTGYDAVENLKLERNTDVPTSKNFGGKVEAAEFADESKEAQDTAAPATPRKRGRKKQTDDVDANLNGKPSTPKKAKTTNINGNDGTPKTATGPTVAGKKDDVTVSPKKISIPTSYEAASAEDRMLLRMKEVEKKSWSEIKEAWEAMTRTKVAAGTLSVRYQRIKANFIVFKEGDDEKLLQAKKEVEERFEATKWQQIATAMEDLGGSKYPVTALQKKLKELTAAAYTASAVIGNQKSKPGVYNINSIGSVSGYEIKDHAYVKAGGREQLAIVHGDRDNDGDDDDDDNEDVLGRIA